ncbi:MAG: hypothetical protein F4027_10790 [Rhodospirillaceae bacterium]|nr:hypothetical protein [Rhodospirillaceae bacterium]
MARNPFPSLAPAAHGVEFDSLDLIPPRLARAFDTGFGRTYSGAQGNAPRQYRQPCAQAAFEAGWKLGRAVHESRGEKVLHLRRLAAILRE